jgi:GAF domain-containing protein
MEGLVHRAMRRPDPRPLIRVNRAIATLLMLVDRGVKYTDEVLIDGRPAMDARRLDRLVSLVHVSPSHSSTQLLTRICCVCASSTAGDGASVSILDNGMPLLRAASDATAEAVESLQTALLQGPGLDACNSRLPSLEPHLSSAAGLSRWPGFSPLAVDAGVHAIFAFPLVTDGAAIGALGIYCLANGEFEDEDVDNALMLADLAALTIERSGPAEYIEQVGLSAEEPQPWAHSAVVHNASGMVSVQLSIGVEEALLRLRAFAFASNRSVADIADDVVARRLRFDHEAQC